MRSKMDVICVGAIERNVLVTGVDADCLQHGSYTERAERIINTAAGDAADMAIVLGRLGNHSAFLGRIGQNAEGQTLLHDLQVTGVDTSLAVVSGTVRHAQRVSLAAKDGDSAVFTAPGMNDLLTTTDYQLPVFAGAAVTAFPLLGAGAISAEDLRQICAEAGRGGGLVAAVLTEDIYHRGFAWAAPVLPYVDFLITDSERAAAVTGEADENAQAQQLLGMGPGNVCILKEDGGCFFANGAEQFTLKGRKVRVLDRAGWLTNFAAGFIHGLIREWPEEECAEFACAVGQISITGIGSNLFIRSEDQVNLYLNDHRE